MRISEALCLTMEDVDLKAKIIRVVDPKNHKDRHLPISDSLAEYCIWYCSKIHSLYHGEDLFFLSNRGDGHYSRNNIQVYFNTIICRMGIPYHGYKGGGPHLHCLRNDKLYITSTALFQKSATAIMAFGVISITSAMPTSATPSVRHSLSCSDTRLSNVCSRGACVFYHPNSKPFAGRTL